MGLLGFTACSICLFLILPAGNALSYREPLPRMKTEISGAAAGEAMTRAYVQTVGRMAYLWGWPLVNMRNRYASFVSVPEAGLVGGVIPVAPLGRNAMLTDYIQPDQKAIVCPNQDVVYGSSFSALDKEPVVFQVPDFDGRFWIYALYDARTEQFGEIGKQYGTKPGFYMIVGPNWKGALPEGVTAAVRSRTEVAFAVPRIFQDDTSEDHEAVQPVLKQIVFYPLSQFDGKMKTEEWANLPHFPFPKSAGSGETRYVDPQTFFDELPEVMRAVPPMPGEESLYDWIASVLDTAAKDDGTKQALRNAAVEAEKTLIDPLIQWRFNGRPAGNGWNSPVNNAQWGTDYLSRTATAKSNIFENRPNETKYIYTDYDSQGNPLYGKAAYRVTFARDGTPPVKGFWSLTLYNDAHFFNPNPLNHYSLGTKSRSLKYNPDGSLTLYAGTKSPGKDKESNWLPAPKGRFSLYIRAYWPDEAILDGSWIPPRVEKVR